MNYYHDYAYLDLIKKVLEDGHKKGDRTGTGTISTFAQQMRFNLADGTIPMLTTKKMFTRGIIHEILWYLKGDTNIKYLLENDVHIWDEWADENGDLGPIYGAQWRRWPATMWIKETGAFGTEDVQTTYYIDQIATVIDQLRNNPNDRRIIVNAWNVGQLDEMALPPCHMMFQFWSRELTADERTVWMKDNISSMTYDCPISDEEKHKKCDKYNVPRRALSCHLYQRSCDVGLGVPFNIVQYSILTHMIAQVTNHVAEEFVWTGGDVHIYNDHVEALQEQLTRKPYPSPQLVLNHKVKEIDDFNIGDFLVTNYENHPTIKMKVSV